MVIVFSVGLEKTCYLFCKGCLMYCSGLAAAGARLFSFEPSSLSGPRCINNKSININVKDLIILILLNAIYGLDTEQGKCSIM